MKDFFVEDILEKFEDYTQPVDQGPRNMYVAGGVIKAAKKLLTKTPEPKPKPSILRREAIPLNLTQVSEISKNKEFEQAWKNYKISIRKVGRRKYSKDQFFEIWARENMAQGGQAGQLVQPSIDGSRPGYAGDDFINLNDIKKYNKNLLDKSIILSTAPGRTGVNQLGDPVTLKNIFNVVEKTAGGDTLIKNFKKNPTNENFIKLKKRRKNRLTFEKQQALPTAEKEALRAKQRISEKKWRDSPSGQKYKIKYLAEQGIFPAATPQERMWRDMYRAQKQKKNQSRFQLKFPKNIKLDPKTGLPTAVKSPKGIFYVPWDKHYKDISFYDTVTKKNIKFNGMENWMKTNIKGGAKKYKNAIENYKITQEISDFKIGDDTIGGLFKSNIGNPTLSKLANPAAVNHRSGLDNFWDTEITTSTGNKQLNDKVQSKISAYKNASTPEIKNKIFKQMQTDIKDIKGGATIVIDGKTIGKNPTANSVLGEIGNELGLEKNQIKIFKKMGFRCKKAGGGVEDVACYLEDVKKTKADARSSDVLKRAKALTKERKALQVAKTLPKVGNIIRKGVQLGAGAVSGALSAVGLGPVGFAIEAAVEGGFYDNARRNGYTHEQAYAETFLPKLITDAVGTTNTDTRLFEGAESLIEKEKLGKEDSLANQYNNAQNIFEQETNALNNMVGSYEQMVDGKQRDELLEKIYLQEAKVKNLMNTIKPGTPAYEAYQIAEETQTGRMENRKQDYLSMNRIPYIDAQGNMQEKTFPLSPAQIKQQEQKLQSRIKSGDKRRDKEMAEYKTGYEGTLEPLFLKENEKANWSGAYGDGLDQQANKWKDIFEGGGAYDLTDKIAIAGGVSKMATGGLANLMKKYYD